MPEKAEVQPKIKWPPVFKLLALLAVSGPISIVAGVSIIAGLGYGLIALGLALLIGAVVLSIGIRASA